VHSPAQMMLTGSGLRRVAALLAADAASLMYLHDGSLLQRHDSLDRSFSRVFCCCCDTTKPEVTETLSLSARPSRKRYPSRHDAEASESEVRGSWGLQLTVDCGERDGSQGGSLVNSSLRRSSAGQAGLPPSTALSDQQQQKDAATCCAAAAGGSVESSSSSSRSIAYCQPGP
jgi:hypothetical protein